MKLKVGSIEVSKVNDENDNALPLQFAFPNVTAEDLRELKSVYADDLLADTPEASRMKLNLHSFILTLAGKTFLIDSCAGNHKKRTIPFFDNLDTPYLANLARAGYRPEDIDYVMCTHLHFDHVGWNTRLENGKWVPTFPNARYVFTKKDYDYFDQHHDDPLYGAAFVDSVLPIAEAGMAELVDVDHKVIHHLNDEVWLEGAPGHSPGSCMIHAKRASDHAIFSGDLVHHPLQMLRPDLRLQADMDPTLGCQTRGEVFGRIADTSSVLLPAHFGKTSAGHVCRHKNGFKFNFLDPV